MKLTSRLALGCSLVLAGLFLLQSLASAGRPAAPLTFTKDVASIVFSNCAACHRPGEVAPMSLLSYKEVRPWARSIKEKVLSREMPPWGADPHYGEFSNDRRLSQKDIDTIAAWVDAGAPEGDPKDLPPLPGFVEGWNIGKPDVIFSMPEEVSVPADGVMPYKDFEVPTNFTEDKYIQAAEIRVGNRSVVHHAVVNVKEPGGHSLTADEDLFRWQENRLAGYAPGGGPLVLKPGEAKLVKKGSVLIFDMHYTPNGTPARDRTSLGLVFANGPVQKRVITAIVGTHHFEIPPGDPGFEIDASYVFKEDVHIYSVHPHMHARGKDFRYTLVYPDGKSKVLAFVPRYNFNWQLSYVFKEPISAPRGSRLECVAHYDNSLQNKYNPDPAKSVRYGPQTWDEMMAGYIEYTRDSQNLLQETAMQGASK
jgi:mono/diheme cytochrome c family protein